jgi:hypothetical protein
MFWNDIAVMTAHIVNILEATELYMYLMWILPQSINFLKREWCQCFLCQQSRIVMTCLISSSPGSLWFSSLVGLSPGRASLQKKIKCRTGITPIPGAGNNFCPMTPLRHLYFYSSFVILMDFGVDFQFVLLICRPKTCLGRGSSL